MQIHSTPNIKQLPIKPTRTASHANHQPFLLRFGFLERKSSVSDSFEQALINAGLGILPNAIERVKTIEEVEKLSQEYWTSLNKGTSVTESHKIKTVMLQQIKDAISPGKKWGILIFPSLSPYVARDGSLAPSAQQYCAAFKKIAWQNGYGCLLPVVSTATPKTVKMTVAAGKAPQIPPVLHQQILEKIRAVALQNAALDLEVRKAGINGLQLAQEMVSQLERILVLDKEFWEFYLPKDVAPLKAELQAKIQSAANTQEGKLTLTGLTGYIAPDNTLSRDGERQIAAYRKLARELGYGTSSPTIDFKNQTISFPVVKGAVKHIDSTLYQKILKTIEPDIQRKDLFPQDLQNLHFMQGKIGNCYFLAALLSLSRHPQGKAFLSQMIKLRSTGYTVTFPGYSAKPIRLTPSDIREFGDDSVKGPPGVKILERAYAELRRQHYTLGQNVIGRKTALTGGYGGLALRDLTDGALRWYDAAGQKEPNAETRNIPYENINTFAKSVPTTQKTITDILNQLSREKEKFIVTANTPDKAFASYKETRAGAQSGQDKEVGFMDGDEKIDSNHAFAVVDINASQHTVTIVDPHNTTIEYVLSYQEFMQFFNSVSAVKITP